MVTKIGFAVGLLIVTANIESCVMFIFMMAEMMRCFFLLVSTIICCHRPGDLERQEEHHKKNQIAAHGRQYSEEALLSDGLDVSKSGLTMECTPRFMV